MTNSDTPSAYKGDRIAKVMARAGVCSRREAERFIEEGRVAVDGRKLTTPAYNVTPQQTITLDGKPVAAPEPPRLWRYHKPAGLVTTESDPQGRPTVFQKLPAGLPRVNSVGRLDINTEGLLLLTNDGGLKRYLELPSTGWLRRYRVRAFGKADEAALRALKKGITIDGVSYRGIEAELERTQGGNVWLQMALREGKNREIKRVLEHLDLQVNRLIRLSFGPFQLGNLDEGKVEEVPRRVLRQQLGKQWSALAELPPPRDDKRPEKRNDGRDKPKDDRKSRPARRDDRGDTRRPQQARGKPGVKADGRGPKPGGRNSKHNGPKAGKPRQGGHADRRR